MSTNDTENMFFIALKDGVLNLMVYRFLLLEQNHKNCPQNLPGTNTLAYLASVLVIRRDTFYDIRWGKVEVLNLMMQILTFWPRSFIKLSEKACQWQHTSLFWWIINDNGDTFYRIEECTIEVLNLMVLILTFWPGH